MTVYAIRIGAIFEDAVSHRDIVAVSRGSYDKFNQKRDPDLTQTTLYTPRKRNSEK